MRRLFLIALTICASTCIPGICANVSNLEDVSFSITSPIDQSLWIATQGHGIVRLGKGGRCFVYSSSKGDFPSDSISVLAFDSEGRLWMKDNAGRLFRYSSLEGFVSQATEPTGLFPVMVEEPVMPEVAQGDSKSPVLPWVVAVISLLVLVGYNVVSSRKKSTPADVPTLIQEESKPQQSAVKPPNVSLSNVTFYNTVMGLIKENISNPDFSVEDIATHTGLSRIHVNRKLKAACNLSPSAIIKSERMKIASDLLSSGEHSIAEIATMCGFSSQAYFSSAFKEFYGVSPSSYKGSGTF